MEKEENKLNYTDAFQAFGHALLANIWLATTNHMAEPEVKGEVYFASLVEGTSESHDKGHGSGRSKELGPHLPNISWSTFVLKNDLLFI